MSSFPESDLVQPDFHGDTMPEFNPDFFMELPSCFLQGLTPDQIAHRSQVYRTAYEKARETASRRRADRVWMKDNGLNFGDGI